MQSVLFPGIPGGQGRCSRKNRVALPRFSPRRSPQHPAVVPVAYRDGAVLTFLFDRSTTIVDLMAMVSRAGQVRKVVL